MSSMKYTISSIKQLIDLNGKSINFHLSFSVRSLTKEPFDALVVTQEMLDSNEPLNYQRADGEISGQIKSEHGIYNNYFLCLKSDKPMEVEVIVNINPLPVAPAQPQPQQPQQQLMRKKRTEGYYEDEEEVLETKKLSKSSSSDGNGNSNFTIILIIVFLCLAAIALTVLYYYRNSQKVDATATPKVDAMIKDGFNDLGEKLLKLNETTSRVNEGLHDVTNKVTHNIHSGFDKLHHDFSENISSISENISKISIPDNSKFTDLGEIKDSINNLKSLYSQNNMSVQPSAAAPVVAAPPVTLAPSLDGLSSAAAVSNAEEVLSRLNSMKILNKQA